MRLLPFCKRLMPLPQSGKFIPGLCLCRELEDVQLILVLRSRTFGLCFSGLFRSRPFRRVVYWGKRHCLLAFFTAESHSFSFSYGSLGVVKSKKYENKVPYASEVDESGRGSLRTGNTWTKYSINMPPSFAWHLTDYLCVQSTPSKTLILVNHHLQAS